MRVQYRGYSVASIAALLLIAGQTAFCQVPPDIGSYRNEPRGTAAETAEGTLNGNRIVSLFSNDGQVGHWPYTPTGVWPKGTNHPYFDGFTLLVSASVRCPGNAQIVHPVETNYRTQVNMNPITFELWTMEPVPGYKSPSGSTPAISTNPSSWPAGWGGRWHGMYGEDSLVATWESFYVMDDSKDAQWTVPPYSYFPIAGDSSRGGLGLRVEVRVLQWADSIAQDILFLVYDVINLSDVDYDSTSFGMFMEPDVGGVNSGYNCARYDPLRKFAYAWNPQGLGVPGNWPTGFLGVSFLEQPDSLFPDGAVPMAGFSVNLASDQSSTGAWPKNDEVLWRKMIGGFGDTAANGTGHLTVVGGTAPFALKKWSRRHFSVALFCADTLENLYKTSDVACQIVAAGYRLPRTAGIAGGREHSMPTNFRLEQNYPNPFNPTTTIAYTVGGVSDVKLVVYDVLGRAVATLVNGVKPPGNYSLEFDGSDLASGLYFYRLQAGGFEQTRKFLLLK